MNFYQSTLAFAGVIQSFRNSMDWEVIKIAYVPYHKSFAVPGDRRRFVFYANERKIKFHIADLATEYDLVYLTYGCNLSDWFEYKKKYPKVKFIFELIDSYLLEDVGTLTIFRGIVWYFLGRESALWLNYKTALRKMISICDAVVCSTHVQRANMIGFNRNIHISLDYFSNEITHHKTSFKSNKKMKVVWEGQAYTVKNLLILKDILEQLRDKIELYIITDPVAKSPIKFFNKKKKNILNVLKCDYHLIDWNKNSFSEIISSADLAIIPIERDSSMMWNKPENKLLLLWEIGVPTLTSDTPAYKRVMRDAGLDFYCASPAEWLQKINIYIESSIEYRVDVAEKAMKYLDTHHKKLDILNTWDRIFDSLQCERICEKSCAR